MASGLLSAELAATCNAIGFYDGVKYHLEPHSKETIKDIIRYLRRDEQSHDIRRFLGNSKILKTDLLPILQCHSKEKDLFDLILRLIVNLSTPALIVYNEVVPTDKCDVNQYLQIVSHLQSYKEAFGEHKSWAVLAEQLSTLLNKDIENRDDDDQRTIERILILVRNVLHVQSDALVEGRPDDDASLHDQVIWALHQSSMLDLLLYMASSSQESAFFMHLLEIICLLVREQPPSLLAKTNAQRSCEEKSRDEEELIKLRQKEQQIRQNKTRQYLGSRHSNFGGTFVIKNMKSTTDNDLIYHKPLHKVQHFSLDADKKKVKIPKNRRPLKCANVERRSALSVRLILKQFCVEILNAAYNPLMRYIKDCLSRGKTQDNDESYFFTAMTFFMEFNRNYKFQVKLVSETMSVESFHYTQKFLETWHEMMMTDKKKISLWSARMHLALKAYKELLQNLSLMDSNADTAVRESSKVIKSNIFYVIEYREMLLTLINTYKKSKYSHQYLIDLMETTHIFLKLLDKFCQNKKMVVQETGRRHKKPKAKKKKQQEGITFAAEELWPQVQNSLEKILASPITKEVIPFDVASEKSMEEQKIDAMKRIQLLLKSGDVEESVALLRASREVWPENDSFGIPNISQEEELACLKEVFLADLNIPDDLLQKNEEIIEDDEEEDEEEETVYPTLSEKTFDIFDLVKRFASPKVLGVCITLLSTFEINSKFTNHCIAKMLHRIAWDCKLPSMLFQASLFRKFQLILESKDPSLKELAGLAIYVIRKFVQVAETNKKVFMELLFFKHSKDAYEIECGYGSFQKESKPSKQNWEEHEEDELRRLHEEYLQTMPSEGMIEWITGQMISERSERIVKKKLKELGLSILTKNKKGLATSWSDEQDEELTSLYKEFKDDYNGYHIIEKIIEKLNVTRSHQNIAKALVRLGFAESTKEFRKKPIKSGLNKKKAKESSSESESSEEEEETRGEMRTKEPAPDLYHTTRLIFSEKDVNSYLTEGLKWLSSCMEDCLEDLDDDPTEVPLLPLSNEAILSVENPEFKLFLSSLNIFRPLQQEIYWRFPADWKEQDFKSRQKLVDLIASLEDIHDHTEEINQCIKEITGQEPPERSSYTSDESDNPSDEPHSNSPSSLTPISDKNTSKVKNNKFQRMKNKLSSNDDSPVSVKKKIDKKLSLEQLDEASTEEFNAIVNEHCRELLMEEGIDVSSKVNTSSVHSDSYKDPSSHVKHKFLESDSEEESLQVSSKGLTTSKRPRLIDSEDEEINSTEVDGTTTSKKYLKQSQLNSSSEDEVTVAKKSTIPVSGSSINIGKKEISDTPGKNMNKRAKRYRVMNSDSEDETTEERGEINSPRLTNPEENKTRKLAKGSYLLNRNSEDEASPIRPKIIKDKIGREEFDIPKTAEKLSYKNTNLVGSQDINYTELTYNITNSPKLRDPNSTEDQNQQHNKKVNKPRKSRILDSDSEDDLEGKKENAKPSDGNSQNEVTSLGFSSKRSRLTDSESEDNLELKLKKKIHVIDSDEDDL